MLVSKLLTECSAILIDSGNARWTASELLDYYNMGVRLISTLIPAAFPVTDTKLLDSGTKQNIPANANRLINVIKNMGASGVDEGRAITLVNREIMNRTYPGWTTDTSAEEVIHYMYDGNSPLEFYIYPPNNGTGNIRLSYNVTPTEVSDTSTTIVAKSDFIPILFEYILWQAFVKDSDSPNSQEKAKEHKENVRQLVLAKGGADLNSNPNTNEIPPMRKQ